MFYNNSLEIVGVGQGTVDSLGIYQPGEETILKTIPSDIQPYSKELAFRDYNFTENVVYRFFCDIDNDIKTGTIVKYNDDRYKIVKIIPWDDYLEGLIDNE